VFVNICGITQAADAQHAVRQGATALGFVFWPRSSRSVTPERAAEIIAGLPASVMTVGVFVNEPVDRIRRIAEQARLTAVQLHGDEPPAYADALAWPVFRSVTLDTAPQACASWSAATTLLLDAADPERHGGTGMIVDWRRAAQLASRRRVVLAGGLTPANVGEAIAAVRPYGVDVSSGVEQAPGVKDVDKVTHFLASARDAFEKRGEG
jgi:phosphoribosylanthranilate isomerase